MEAVRHCGLASNDRSFIQQRFGERLIARVGFRNAMDVLTRQKCFLTRVSRPSRRICVRVNSWLRPPSSRPGYDDYRTRRDIQESYAQEWLETTGTEEVAAIPKRTFMSTLLFLPAFLKYYIVPLFVRYLWYLMWSALRARWLYPLQKRCVKWDVQMDSLLGKLKRGENSDRKFALGMALARFHGRVGVFGDLRYRFALLTTGDVDAWKKLYTKRVEKISRRKQQELMTMEEMERQEAHLLWPGGYNELPQT